jgi:hypothetical protein
MNGQADQLRRLMAVFKQYAVDEAAPVARRPAVLKTVAARPARNIGLALSAPDETKFTRLV